MADRRGLKNFEDHGGQGDDGDDAISAAKRRRINETRYGGHQGQAWSGSDRVR